LQLRSLSPQQKRKVGVRAQALSSFPCTSGVPPAVEQQQQGRGMNNGTKGVAPPQVWKIT